MELERRRRGGAAGDVSRKPSVVWPAAPHPLTVKPQDSKSKSRSSPESKLAQLKLQCARPARKLSWPDSASTKLKVLWCNTFSEEEQDYWREQFVSARSQASIRRELEQKYDLDFKNDWRLTVFRRWVDAQDLRLAEAELVAADEAELTAQGLHGEQLREALLERMKARALTKGDFKLGATAVKLDLQAEAMALNQQKFKESLRTKAQAGLAEVLAEAKDDPVIAAAVKQIQEATK